MCIPRAAVAAALVALMLSFAACRTAAGQDAAPEAEVGNIPDVPPAAAPDDVGSLLKRLEDAERRLAEMERRQETQVLGDDAAMGTGERASDGEGPDESPVTGDFVPDLSPQQEQKAEATGAGDIAKAIKTPKPSLQWTGRVQADYWAFPGQSPGEDAFENGDADDNIEDRFLFRRVRIGVQGDVPDFMLYKLEVDFNNPNSPQLKDNFIGWDDVPYFQLVLFGNQKRPYGLDLINSSRYTVFLERPAIVEALNPDSRRFGLQSYGVSEDLRYNWRYGAFMGRDIQNVGTVTATPEDGDYQAEFAWRLAQTTWYENDGRDYLHLAFAGTVASTDGDADAEFSTARFNSRPEARTTTRWLDTGVIAGADSYQVVGSELMWNQGPLSVSGELMQAWVQRHDYTNVAFQGGYIYVAYFLTGEHTPWDRETGQLGRVQPKHNFFWVRDPGDKCPGWGAWQIGARYSYADLTDADIRGGIENNLTLALNWHWNPYARLQMNYIYGRIHDHRPVDGFTEGDYHFIGTRVCVDF